MVFTSGHSETFNVHNRPIRPLPKRRLRSRLSEEAKASILPPAAPSSTRLFHLPYTPFAESGYLTRSTNTGPLEVTTRPYVENAEGSSDEEDSALASTVGREHSKATVTVSPDSTSGPTVGQLDSYDWVENTNNKKKRKIPSPAHHVAATGNFGSGHSVLQTAASNFSSTMPSPITRNRWKPSVPAQRVPIVTTPGTYPNPRRTPRRLLPAYDNRTNIGKPHSVSGSDDTLSTTSSLNEISMERHGLPGLRQSQFTFEHLTPASSSLALQSSLHSNLNSAVNGQRTMSTVGTQTSPNMSNSNSYPMNVSGKKKPSKKPQQSRSRRPGAYNQVNPNGEIWICEFCEYESIFGERPEALIRQYDIKERRERRRLREKQRLLDKAKAKGKKGHTKSGKKVTGTPQHNAAGGTPPPSSPPVTDESLPPQPLAATHPPARQSRPLNAQHPSHPIHHDGNGDHVSTGRGAGGSGGVGGGGGKPASTAPTVRTSSAGQGTGVQL